MAYAAKESARPPRSTASALERLPPDARGARLTQTARFRPKGLFGLAYWYAILPVHAIVFEGMIQGIRREAQRRTGGEAAARA